MKKNILAILLGVFMITTIFALEYTIELVDSFGDGWNGGTITVNVNSSPVLSDITLSSGSGPEAHIFNVEYGDLIETVYEAGYYGFENEYQIKDQSGAVVAQSGQGGDTPGNVSYQVPPAGTPDIPVLVSPANNSGNNELNPNFEWTLGDNTESANLHLADNAEFLNETIINSATSPYTTTLAEASQYFWKVVAVSESGIETSSPVHTFRTINVAITEFPYAVDFEVWPPIDWSLNPESGSGAWVQNDGTSNGPGASYAGQYSAMFNNFDYSSGTSGSLETPLLDLSSLDNPLVKFHWWNNDGTSGSIAQLNIYTKEYGDWVLLENIQTYGSGTTTWVETSNPISNTTRFIKIEAISDYGSKNTYIDNFVIEEAPTSPIAYLSATEIDFGSLNLYNTDNTATETISIQNIGVGILNISDVAIIGTNADQFTYMDNGAYALGAYESLAIDVTFTPTSEGEKTATLQITDDLTRLVHEVSLTGTGVDNSISAPISLDFEGSTTTPEQIESTNMSIISSHGNTSNVLYKNIYTASTSAYLQFYPINNIAQDHILKFDYRFVAYGSPWPGIDFIDNFDYMKIQVSTDFGATFTQIDQINATNHTTTDVFTTYLVDLGDYVGDYLVIRLDMPDDGDNDYYCDIDNIFIEEAPTSPIAYLSATEIDFSSTQLFSTIATETISIQNIGGGILNISDVAITGTNASEFSFYVDPESSMALEIGQSLAIDVTFTPTSEGEKTATLQITDDLTRLVHEVSLTGTGVDNSISAPISLDFEGSTTTPEQIESTNMSITSSYGNTSNVLYKNIYTASTSAYLQFSPINNIAQDHILKFDYRFVAYGSPWPGIDFIDNFDYMKIQVSTDFGASFTQIDQINATNHTTTDVFTTYLVDLGDYVGDYLVIRLDMPYAGVNDYYCDIDNIFIGELPTSPIAYLSATEIDFGSLYLTNTATETISIQNIGLGILNISDVAITGTNASEFSFYVDPESSMALAEGQSLAIDVTFTPTSGGEKTATLQITDDLGRLVRFARPALTNSRNNSRNDNNVSLSGMGIDNTIYGLPFTEGFEENNSHDSSDIYNWQQISEAGSGLWTINETYTDYNRIPRTGLFNATLRYGNTDWVVRPVELMADQIYEVELYARQDGSGTSNASIEVYYGTDLTGQNMTSITGQVGLTNGDYQQITGTFTPPSTGVYYIGIRGEINYSPWYISLDDITIREYIPPVPEIPNNVQLVVDNGQVTITWDASLNANSYEIWASDSAEGNYVLVETIAGTEYTSSIVSDMKFFKIKASSTTLRSTFQQLGRRK